MLFAALVICLSSSMLNEASANINSNGVRGSDDGIMLVVDRSGGSKTPSTGGGVFDLGGYGNDGVLGSNGYLIIAIAGIAIVVAVLLIIKFVIPKLKAK